MHIWESNFTACAKRSSDGVKISFIGLYDLEVLRCAHTHSGGCGRVLRGISRILSTYKQPGAAHKSPHARAHPTAQRVKSKRGVCPWDRGIIAAAVTSFFTANEPCNCKVERGAQPNRLHEVNHVKLWRNQLSPMRNEESRRRDAFLFFAVEYYKIH